MAARLDRFTTKAQEAVSESQNFASTAGDPEITSEHLLLALLQQEGGIVSPILSKLGLSGSALETSLASFLERRPKVDGGAEPQPNAQFRKALEAAAAAAKSFQD